jgi:hypothetical protein
VEAKTLGLPYSTKYLRRAEITQDNNETVYVQKVLLFIKVFGENDSHALL